MSISTSNKNLISATLANHMLRCLEEYEAIKSKRSSKFKTVLEFCKHYGFSWQNFLNISKFSRIKRNLSSFPALSEIYQVFPH